MGNEVWTTISEAFENAKEVITRFADLVKKLMSFFDKKKDEA